MSPKLVVERTGIDPVLDVRNVDVVQLGDTEWHACTVSTTLGPLELLHQIAVGCVVDDHPDLTGRRRRHSDEVTVTGRGATREDQPTRAVSVAIRRGAAVSYKDLHDVGGEGRIRLDGACVHGVRGAATAATRREKYSDGNNKQRFPDS